MQTKVTEETQAGGQSEERGPRRAGIAGAIGVILLVALEAAVVGRGDESVETGQQAVSEPFDASPENEAAEQSAAPSREAAVADDNAAETEIDASDPLRDGEIIDSTLSSPDYDFTEASETISAFIDQRNLNGAALVVVQRDDGVVHEEYWGDFDADRVSLVSTASKGVAAGVLVRLSDQGLLDLDAPVADVVDWGTGNPEITPAQLLSNSSGLPGLFPNLEFEPYACQWSAESSLQDCARQAFTTPDDDASIDEPDNIARYGGVQWQVAGAVAEAASGRSWSDLIGETYLEPCGLEAGAFGFSNGFLEETYPRDFNGDSATLPVTENPNIEGGLYATAPAFAEFLLMNVRGGLCGDGERALSQDGLDAMHADRIGEVYGGHLQADKAYGYGLGWYIDRQDGTRAEQGFWGAVPWLDREDGYGAYLVLEANHSAGFSLFRSLQEPIDQAVLAAR